MDFGLLLLLTTPISFSIDQNRKILGSLESPSFKLFNKLKKIYIRIFFKKLNFLSDDAKELSECWSDTAEIFSYVAMISGSSKTFGLVEFQEPNPRQVLVL